MFEMQEMPEHLDAHVPRDDGFRHGGHADGVGAEGAEGADLGRRLVARAGHGDVDAVLDGRPMSAAAWSASPRSRFE